ncbi:MAG: methyl-accepting chemotaxis protein [Firmicutes bacterium]|nr:methyl-accepting chemotaxis protein [Bacillota bacterium]
MVKSLKTKLILGMALLLLVFLSVTGIFSFLTAKRILESQIFVTAQNSALTNARVADRFINGIKQELAALAATPDIQSMDWQRQQPILSRVFANHANWENLYVVDLTLTARTAMGEIVDVANRPYIGEAIRTRQMIVASPVSSKLTGKYIVPIVLPIIPAGSSEVVGVLGMNLELSYLQDVVRGMKVDGINGNGVIVDSTKITVAHVEEKYIGNSQALQDGNDAFRSIIARMVQGEQGVELYRINGRSKLMAYAPVEVAKWSIAVVADLDDVLAPVNRLRNIIIAIILLGLAIASGFAYYFALVTVRPVLRVQAVAEALADGDLTQTVEVKSQDEIGRMARAFNQAISNLTELIGQVSNTAENVAAASEELSAASEEVGQATQQVVEAVNQMARGADQQAKDSVDMSQAIEGLSARVAQVANSSQLMTQYADQVIAVANEGGELIRQTTDQMEVIKEVSTQIGNAITSLGAMSQEIGKIIGVITGIADQTNLLALNAAIEAARAGEQGRGFAVVAEEVRKLAEQSREAATQITELIDQIQTEMDKAVDAQGRNSVEVANGQAAIGQTGAAFATIIDSIQQVVRQIQEVNDAAHHLSVNSEEMVKMVTSVAATAEESAAGAQEISASAEEQNASVQEIAGSAQALAQMAEQLQLAVRRFRL